MKSIANLILGLVLGALIGGVSVGYFSMKVYADSAQTYKIGAGTYVVHALYMPDKGTDIRVIKLPLSKMGLR